MCAILPESIVTSYAKEQGFEQSRSLNLAVLNTHPQNQKNLHEYMQVFFRTP
jgi:hypothetical protein